MIGFRIIESKKNGQITYHQTMEFSINDWKIDIWYQMIEIWKMDMLSKQ